MPTNDIKAVAQAVGANVLTQAEYVALTDFLNEGFSSGVVPSDQFNKALRQALLMAYIVAQYTVDLSGDSVLDDGTPATILASLKKGIAAQIDTQSGNYALDTGAADAYVIALDPPITAYPNGLTVRFRAANTNTGASTLNAGGGVVGLRNNVDGALVAGDIPVGTIVTATYITALTRFNITSVVASQTLTQTAADLRYLSLANEVGTMRFVPANAAPTGYLKMNGALVSRTTYAALYAFAVASGNISANDGAWVSGQFSPGDGSTTFRLPDYRGYFLRSWDDARGIDAGRAIGTVQADSVIEHIHKTTLAGSQSIGAGGSTVTSSNSTINGGTILSSGMRDAADSAWIGGTETRPVNLAALACIKY